MFVSPSEGRGGQGSTGGRLVLVPSPSPEPRHRPLWPEGQNWRAAQSCMPIGGFGARPQGPVLTGTARTGIGKATHHEIPGNWGNWPSLYRYRILIRVCLNGHRRCGSHQPLITMLTLANKAHCSRLRKTTNETRGHPVQATALGLAKSFHQIFEIEKDR